MLSDPIYQTHSPSRCLFTQSKPWSLLVCTVLGVTLSSYQKVPTIYYVSMTTSGFLGIVELLSIGRELIS